MTDTVERFLQGISAVRERLALTAILKPIAERYCTQATVSAGLVIKAGGGVLAKVGAVPFAGVVRGIPVAIAAGADMPALVGSITATFFNVFCFFIDQAGTLTVAMGKEGATLAAMKWPEFPAEKALVGYLVVTHSATFVGNTTALDTATTVYVSPTGAFDPNLLP